MSDIAGDFSKIQVEESSYRSGVSESLCQRLGANINQMIDEFADIEGRALEFNGYTAPAATNFGVAGPTTVLTVPADHIYIMNVAMLLGARTCDLGPSATVKILNASNTLVSQFDHYSPTYWNGSALAAVAQNVRDTLVLPPGYKVSIQSFAALFYHLDYIDLKALDV